MFGVTLTVQKTAFIVHIEFKSNSSKLADYQTVEYLNSLNWVLIVDVVSLDAFYLKTMNAFTLRGIFAAEDTST